MKPRKCVKKHLRYYNLIEASITDVTESSLICESTCDSTHTYFIQKLFDLDGETIKKMNLKCAYLIS